MGLRTGHPKEDDVRWDAAAAALRLTPGELVALQAILKGDGEKEAAARLRITRRALHARLERLHQRLGVHSRTELILKVIAASGAPR